MMRLILLLLLGTLLGACEGNTKARKAARGENFVPDPNYIFFKNTRQRHYQLLDRGEAGNYFSHDDLLASDASLIPVIHDDWLNDRAYLQLHTRRKPAPPAPGGPVKFVITSATGDNTVELAARPDVAALTQLDAHLATKRPVRIVLGQDTLTAFPGEARRQAREVIFDYLRLVDLR